MHPLHREAAPLTRYATSLLANSNYQSFISCLSSARQLRAQLTCERHQMLHERTVPIQRHYSNGSSVSSTLIVRISRLRRICSHSPPG